MSLRRWSQAVNTLNELDDILSAVARITPILVGVERCLIYLWDEGEEVFRLAQAYGLSQEAQATLSTRTYAPAEFALLDEVRGQNSPVTYSPGQSDQAPGGRTTLPDELADILTETGRQDPGQLMAVPLSVKGEVLGAMLLAEPPTRARKGVQLAKSSPFSTREKRIEIMAGIAHQAAMAVQNERFQQERLGRERLERELQLAREIQQIFIPDHLPRLQGWELAAMWRAPPWP